MLQGLAKKSRNLFPPRRSAFDFQAAADKFAHRLEKDWASRPEPPQRFPDRIGVIVSPWLFTPAPFFMLELALQLRLAGHPVIAIWDASETFADAVKPREIAAIRPLLDYLPPWLSYVDIASIAATKQSSFGFVDQLLYENSVRHLRGENGAEALLLRNPQWKSAMQMHAARVASFIESDSADRFCIPGGVWASSGIWNSVCKVLQVPYTTYDSGPGQVFVSRNSPAAHFGDVRSTLEAILDSGEDIRPLIALAREALQIRMDGRDPFALQQSARTQYGEKYDVVLPLNLRFDSAALCRQRVFCSVTEWLETLLDRLSVSGKTTIAIRQHPCERLDSFKGSDVWHETLARFLRPGGPIRFFPAEADINTYDLIENAKVVLPFTSRVGIEAAMMGKPVVTSADCYYDKCGFATAAPDADNYFLAISDALEGGLRPDEQARERAALAYYIMEYCTALRCCLTPQPADFGVWTRLSSDNLGDISEVKPLLQAVAGLAPLTSLIHQRNSKRDWL